MLVGRESFLVTPQVAQSVTGVAQTIRLPAPGSAHLSVEVQGLLVGGGCFVGASHSVQGVADALVEAVGLLTLGSVHLAEQLQGLLVGRESFLVTPQVAQSITGIA